MIAIGTPRVYQCRRTNASKRSRLAKYHSICPIMPTPREADAPLPACDRTDSLTAPFSTYITLVAGSPWTKICVAGSCSTRCTRTPVQSTGSMGLTAGALFDLLIRRRQTSPASPTWPPAVRTPTWYVQLATSAHRSQPRDPYSGARWDVRTGRLRRWKLAAAAGRR
jgi:hypothetical protein